MLDNLLSNAIRYTPPHGQIRITFLQGVAHDLTDDQYTMIKGSSKQRLTMWIEDNGEGVDSSLRNHLFERFMTDYHNPKGKTGGSGLGLAIVKRVVDAHQGKIMLLNQDYSETKTQTMIALSMQPLIWGDTFGEIIGSFFGKYEFSVIGKPSLSILLTTTLGYS